MKRSILIPAILIIYLGVMAYLGWPEFSAQGKYLEFTAVIIVTLAIITGIFFLLRRRDKMRRENQKQRQASQRRFFRDDNIR